jgi:hypothetical protein
MANNSRPSFIPRRTPTAPKKQPSSRSIGLFGYLSYILFFGSILLSLGMFIVSQQVQNTLQEKQTELATIKDQFQQSEMDRVQEYERFLEQLTAVFSRSISIERLFAAVEDSVVEKIFFTEMTLERAIESLALSASVQSNSFDTALFQRNVYTEFPVLETFTLEEVALQSAGQPTATTQSDEEDTTTENDVVTFSLTFDLAASSLPFSPQVVPVDADLEDDNNETAAATTNTNDT